MNTFAQKPVAVLNKSIEPGKVMNALAHMCLGLGALMGKDTLELIDYHDQSGALHCHISKMPLIILAANSNKISQLRMEAVSQQIPFVDFVDTMTVGTYQEQLKRTAQTAPENLIYYGITLLGEWESVTALTRKFSLWK